MKRCVHEKRAEVSSEVSTGWRAVCWFGFSFVGPRNALIESSSPVPRSAFSWNYTLFGLAFLLLFWLGFATDLAHYYPFSVVKMLNRVEPIRDLLEVWPTSLY